MTKTKMLKKQWKRMLEANHHNSWFDIFLHADDAMLSGFWTKDYVSSYFNHVRLMYVEDITWKGST